MNVLKTVLDFLLSVARLFFRGKSRKRRICPQCGALVRADRRCSCNSGATGGSDGGSGGDYDPAPDTDETEEKCSGEEENDDEEEEPPTFRCAFVIIAGWFLFISAAVSTYVRI